MRKNLVEADLVECVIGLGPNLFYNSPMEACVVVCRTTKPKVRRGRILFIDALHEIARERTQSFLRDEHQERIVEAYRVFEDEPGFATVATREEVAAQEYSLSIPLYVKRAATNDIDAEPKNLRTAWDEWTESTPVFWSEMDALIDALDGLVEREVADG